MRRKEEWENKRQRKWQRERKKDWERKEMKGINREVENEKAYKKDIERGT